MEGKVIVRARIKVETLKKMRAVRREPRRAWGKHHVPDYFGSFIEDLTETIEFRLLEKDAQIQSLKSEVFLRELALKCKATEMEKKNKDMEALREQIVRLTAGQTEEVTDLNNNK